MKVNNTLKFVLIIQVQIIFILAFVLLYKIFDIDKRIFNTNKFVHEVMVDKRKEALMEVTKNDIILGNKNAPLTMILYSRFNCQACNELIQNTLPKIEKNFISNGNINFVVRYLTHQSKPKSLYATKTAYYMYKVGFYREYSTFMLNHAPNLDSTIIENIVTELLGDTNGLQDFVNSRESDFILLNAKQAREVGIRSTPTIILNDEKLVGTRPYQKYHKLISSELENVACE